MKTVRIREAGFTLIELLTVIAIIGILGSIALVAIPRALERAKVAKTVATAKQIQTVLVTYASNSGTSYPPSYGYLSREAHGEIPNSDYVNDLRARGALFHTDPYLAILRKFGDTGLYDNWLGSMDTNQDGFIHPLEFSPLGTKIGTDSYDFTEELYFGDNLPGEVAQQLNAESRPFLYFAVNLRQVKRMSDFWFGINPTNPRPREGDPSSPLANMSFPPPSYDAFVLVSIGPEESTRGLITGAFPDSYFNDLQSDDYWYHAMGLFAYFMASRDADGNGELDFEFRARTRRNEGENPNNRMPVPPGGAVNAGGPLIFVTK